MFYVAHVGVKLKNITAAYNRNEWYSIKSEGDIEYRWRLNEDLYYEVIAGLFNEAQKALICAKQMYITLIYTLFKRGFELDKSGCDSYMPRFYDEELDGNKEEFFENEGFFFWTPKYSGGKYGPGVYEVKDSIEDFNNYKCFDVALSVSYDANLEFDNVDEYIFTYNELAQRLLSSVVTAEDAMDYGMKMTIYCSILESLAENAMKSENVQCEIDELLNHVKESDLLDEEKQQLCQFLKLGKEQSARQRCKELIRKYAKPKYGKYTSNKVFSEAYGLRSAFAHGNADYSDRIEIAKYIKLIVLDVIKGYVLDNEE